MLSRRTLLKSASVMAALHVAPAAAFALANAPIDQRLILILQRGAQDGLHAMPPYADKDYKTLRPNLAISRPGTEDGALELDGYFGLHPSLSYTHSLFGSGDALFVPAIATRYRNRSHFDGQNLLENGSGQPYGASDGWLNRALKGLHATDTPVGFNVGYDTPLILQGSSEVHTYAPSTLPEVGDAFLQRLMTNYQADTLFAEALAQGMDPLLDTMSMSRGETRRAATGRDATFAARATSEALLKANGPRIAVIELGGWDTHNAQRPRLNNLFKQLDDTVRTLAETLEPVWNQTVILTMSEFGRTAAQNGSGGTDHGTGGMSMLVGGAVNGGKLAGQWPGLSARSLYEGRDVAPLNTLESVFKALLIEHAGLAESFIEDQVFPNSREIRPFEGLIKHI